MTGLDSGQVVPTVCALAGCGKSVVQPGGGGRKRLYCSNAHRAEARRRRLAEIPDPSPADALSGTVQRLTDVVDELRRHEESLRSIDPTRQAAEGARVRAEATAEVLAAQQAAAAATAEAARANDQMASAAAAWRERLEGLEDELEASRSATRSAREAAASAQDELDDARRALRLEIDSRDEAAARAASAHEAEARRLSQETERLRTAAAAAEARAEAADRRASDAEAAARDAVEQLVETNNEAQRLRVELERSQGTLALAAARAETAERRHDEMRTELAAERDRRDIATAELRDQLAQLVAASARKPPRPARAGSTARASAAAPAGARRLSADPPK